MKLPYLILPTALAGLLLGACDPIQIEIILKNDHPHVPSQGPRDGGLIEWDGGLPPTPPPDAGQQPDAGSRPDGGVCDNGFRTRELASDVAWVSIDFDSRGVGHYAITKTDNRLYVGSSQAGDSLAPAGDLVGGVKGLALDAEGRRHVVFFDNSTTYYAREQSGQWQRTQVAANAYPAALKLDTWGFAHVTLNLGNRRLGYATNRSGQWQVTDLGVTSRNSIAELAVDAQGNAHIGWHADSNTGIYYATNASGAWRIELVEDIGGNEPVVAIDPLGQPHLIYSYGGSSAHHAVKQGGRWVIEGLGASTGIAMDLKVDEAGNLHALLDRPQNPKIVYARRSANGSGWSYTPLINLDGQGGVSYLWRNVLGLDEAGRVHVGYWYIISTDGAGIQGNSVRYAEPCP